VSRRKLLISLALIIAQEGGSQALRNDDHAIAILIKENMSYNQTVIIGYIASR
jgi:hypothetical protein